MTREEIKGLTDEEWAQHISILENIRSEEAKTKNSFI